MSRNGSGSYTLSDTLTNGTSGDADEVNAILQDIATEITNSVAVDGQSTMTGALKAANGSAAAPSYTFGSDTNTGFYRSAADTIGVAANGSSIGSFSSSGYSGAWAQLPSGTAMLFQQTSAPTGWTKSTTHNNKALRVVSGTASSGGTVDFTTAFASKSVSGTVGNTSLTTAQLPAINFNWGASTFNVAAGAAAAALDLPTADGTGTKAGTTNTIGSGDTHTHTFTGTAIDLAVAYVDLIIATKD